MRVLCDTNIFVSYLLTPRKAGPIHSLMQGAFLGEFTLLVPEDVLQELAQKVKGKKYLTGRIRVGDLDELATLLGGVAEVIPKITTPIPAVTRDPKDDYLLAYALVGEADLLVTGDEDLLTIKQVEQTKIITPRQFISIVK
jgi:uncharacterized protein